MGILMMDSMGWPYDSSDCLSLLLLPVSDFQLQSSGCIWKTPTNFCESDRAYQGVKLKGLELGHNCPADSSDPLQSYLKVTLVTICKSCK